jgi:hypothetical protein
MKSIKVTFYCNVPDEVTEQEINEWLAFELNYMGSISENNPLYGTEIEAESVDIE